MKKVISTVTAALVLAMLALPVSATVRPSVEQKGAPEVAQQETKDGTKVVAIILDMNQEEVVGVPDGYLLVTAVAECQKAPEEIREKLTQAYEQVKNADDLEQIVPQLKEDLKKNGIAVSTEKLIVRDLIDVTIGGEYETWLNQEGNTVSVRFEVGISPEILLVVLHNYEADQWETIASDRVLRHENGDVTVTFDSLSPVAFVVEEVETAAPAAQPFPWWWVLILAIGVAGAAYLVATGRKKNTVA